MEFLHSGAWPIIVFGGFAVGFLVGLTGVGAGSLMTPFLISGIGVPPVMAVGTDLLFASITKASAAWRHHSLGNVNWPIVRWLATGSLPGAAVVLAGSTWPRPTSMCSPASSARCSRSPSSSARCASPPIRC